MNLFGFAKGAARRPQRPFALRAFSPLPQTGSFHSRPFPIGCPRSFGRGSVWIFDWSLWL